MFSADGASPLPPYIPNLKTPPTDMYLPRVCPERQHHCLTRYSERWIALAIAIDALPKDSTCDMASETIRANADIDIAERRKSVLPDQAGLAAKKASCIESLAHIGGNAPVCGQNEIAR